LPEELPSCIPEAIPLNDDQIMLLSHSRNLGKVTLSSMQVMEVETGSILSNFEICRGHRNSEFQCVPLRKNEVIVICFHPRCPHSKLLRKVSYYNSRPEMRNID